MQNSNKTPDEMLADSCILVDVNPPWALSSSHLRMWPKTARERGPPFARLDRKAIGVKEERHATLGELVLPDGFANVVHVFWLLRGLPHVRYVKCEMSETTCLGIRWAHSTRCQSMHSRTLPLICYLMNALKVTVSPIATDLFTALHVCAFGVYVERYTTNVWINTADEKLYEGKNSGKNRVVV